MKNRRFYSRREVRSLAYIDLGRDNGGIVLNVSEGGLAIHSAVVLNERRLPHVRFQLPQSTGWIEAKGEVAWTSESKMQAGIQLVGLTDIARKQIRDWVGSSVPAASSQISRTDPAERRPLNTLRVEELPTPAMPPDPPFPSTFYKRKLAATQQQTARNLEVAQTSAPVTRRNTSNSSKGTPERTPALLGSLGRGGGAAQLGLRLGQPPAQPKSRPAWANWVGFSAFLFGMAILSFFAGLRSGTGDSRSLLSGLLRAGAQTDSASASQPRNAVSGSIIDDGLSSTPLIGRVTITSRLYVPVSIPARSDDPKTDRLQVGAITYRPDPQYPADAQKQRTEGTVQLHATIGANGSVQNVAVLSGPSALVDAASSAVRQWQFKPTQLDGKAIETQADIAVVFWLRPAPPHPHSESK